MVAINDQSLSPQIWQANLLIIATALAIAAPNFFAGKGLAYAGLC